MSPTDAFVEFASRVLVPAKAERFRGITFSEKAQQKILDDFCHRFEGAILESAKRGKEILGWRVCPALVFIRPVVSARRTQRCGWRLKRSHLRTVG